MTTLHTLQMGLGWFPEHPGGLERFYYHIGRELPYVDVQAHGLVVGSSMAAAQTDGRVQAFTTHNVSLPLRCLAARSAVSRLLRTTRIDLICAHFAAYAPPIVGWERPSVVHFQGPWAQEASVGGENALRVRLINWMEKCVYRRARLAITLSEAFRTVLHQDYRVPLSKIRVIPGGVDCRQFALRLSRAEARARLGWRAAGPIILTVRRLVSRVGLSELIDAMLEARRQLPEALLLIAGQGPLAGELQQRVVDRGLNNHVRLIGFVPEDDLPIAYRAADLTIVPSQTLEGFGQVVAESLAAGTPALVTPVGGLPEVVHDLSPDLVLAGTDSHAISAGLAAALRGTLHLPDEESCRRHARQFDWPVVAQKIRRVYLEALT